MTPTPRTDAEARRMTIDCDDSCVEIYVNQDGKPVEGDIVLADFARTLERDITELNERLIDRQKTLMAALTENQNLKRELAKANQH